MHLSSAPGGCLQVNALHLHGTGTALGDPIEAGAVAAVLLPGAAAKDAKGAQGTPLALVAHKAATGHAEAAAGALGLAGALIGLEAAALPPILHLRSAPSVPFASYVSAHLHLCLDTSQSRMSLHKCDPMCEQLPDADLLVCHGKGCEPAGGVQPGARG